MNVLMFHSIGNEKSNWHQNWLSVSVKHFERFCKFLNRNKYTTLLLDDWYNLQNTPSKIHKKHVVLTFDDGYLDNWVFAYPILKKYGLKATVFINPEFVDPRNIVRSNLEDVWGNKTKQTDLETLGFLSWKEIKKMDKSGVLVSESHSMSHNFYFNSDEIIDFYTGEDKYSWLSWFLQPVQKPFSLTNDHLKYIPFGFPVFGNDRALRLKRFIPNDIFIEEITTEALKLKNKGLSRTEIKFLLHDFSNLYKKKNETLGSFESDVEQTRRYHYELFESKKILEEKLKRKVNFLCWPGGGYNDLSLNLSKEVSYIGSTLFSKDDSIIDNKKNHYKRISRKGYSSFIMHKNQYFLIKNKNHIITMFRARNKEILYKILITFKIIILKILIKFNIEKSTMNIF